MKKSIVLFVYLVVWVGLSMLPSVKAASDASQNDHSHHQHSLMGSHGMVLIRAGDTLLASHLPLYSAPHHYQLVYRIQFTDADQQKRTMNLLKQGQVTLLPDVFDLSQLVQGENFSLNAVVFDGHFERGGQRVLNGDITFERQVYVRDLRNLSHSEISAIETLPLDNEHLLAIHHIGIAPSFDAVGIIENTRANTDASAALTSCAKMSSALDVEILKAKLSECVDADWQYIETRDFQ